MNVGNVQNSTFNLGQMKYDIKNELIIRKILERNTDYTIEFNENYENEKEYDLRYYKHVKTNTSTGWEKVHIGFVEVEVFTSHSVWLRWPEYSFLKRKIYKYNWQDDTWTDTPKDNYDKTVYLKFNKDFTDCFCAPIALLVNRGFESSRSDGRYNDTFIALDINDPSVTRGIKSCSDFIVNMMEVISDNTHELPIFNT